MTHEKDTQEQAFLFSQLVSGTVEKLDKLFMEETRHLTPKQRYLIRSRVLSFLLVRHFQLSMSAITQKTERAAQDLKDEEGE